MQSANQMSYKEVGLPECLSCWLLDVIGLLLCNDEIEFEIIYWQQLNQNVPPFADTL